MQNVVKFFTNISALELSEDMSSYCLQSGQIGSAVDICNVISRVMTMLDEECF